MRWTENNNKNKTPSHITLLCWHLHRSLAAWRKAELLTSDCFCARFPLSLQSQTRILSILLGHKLKNNTTKLVASSSVCSKDYLSASSSFKSHSYPHLICSLSARCTAKEIHKNTVIQVKDAREISLHFTTKYSVLIKDLLQGQGKPDKRLQWKQEETFRFLTKAVSKRLRYFIKIHASFLKSTEHCLTNL